MQTPDSFLLASPGDGKVQSYGINGSPKRHRFQGGKEKDFLLLYCSQVADKSLAKPYSEVTPEAHPVVVTFAVDFTAPDPIDNYDAELYSSHFIDTIVHATQGVLRDIVGDVDDESNYLYTIIVASRVHYADDDDKEKASVVYRLYFPLCRMENSDQMKYLRPKILTAYRRDNIIENLCITVDKKKLDELVTLPVVKDFLPFYGSSSYADNRATAHSVFVYDDSGKLIDDWSDLGDVFDYHGHEALRRVKENDRKFVFWLPVVLSLHYNGGDVYTPAKLESMMNAEAEGVEEQFRPPEQRVAVTMIDLIPPGYGNYGWKRKLIGKCLYNVFNGSAEGLALWKAWCRRNSNLEPMDDALFERKYRLFSGDPTRKVVTLQQIAKQENPVEYKKWFDEELYKFIEEAGIQRSAGAVERLAFHYFKTTLTHVSGKWYIHTGAYLRQMKVNRKTLEPLVNRIRAASEAAGRPARGAELNYEALLKSLDSGTFPVVVINIMRDSFDSYTEGVMLNSDGTLLATANTYVLHIKKRRGAAIRRGLIEDYLSWHSSVDYDPNFSLSDPASQRERQFSYELHGYESDAVHYKDLRRTRDLLAPSGEKSVQLHVGPANSGKTTDMDVDLKMFGNAQFGHTPDSLTSSKRSGGPTPETAHTNFKKRITAEDPEDVDSKNLNQGWLARESGYANRLARFCNQDGTDSHATANWIMLINDNVALSPTAQMLVRVFAFYFKALYLTTDDAHKMGCTIPETYEGQKKEGIYPRLTLTQEDLLEMGRVRLNYSIMLAKGMDWTRPLERPEVISKWTLSYWLDHDPFTMFKNKHLEHASNGRANVDIMYNVFETWYKRKYHENVAPRYREFIKCMKGVLQRPMQRDTRSGEEFFTGFRIYDSAFSEFVDTMLVRCDDDEYLDARTAWTQFRQWCDASNSRSHVRDQRDFINFMAASVVPYNAKSGGFRGLGIPLIHSAMQ